LTYPVGIIGVGNMGAAMAAHLLQCGWTVNVCDVLARKTEALSLLGAKVAKSASQAAEQSELLIICVVDAEQANDVLFGNHGAAHKLRAGQCVMLCPTIAPEDTESIAARLAVLGIQMMDAPMSGGPAKARNGSMSLMLACSDAVFEAHKELINTLSNQVFRISEKLGDGARTKLINNLLAGINLAGTAEVLALSERMGLNLSTTLNVIEHSSGQSWIGTDRMRRAIAADFEPRAHTTLLAKDTNLAVAAAKSVRFNASMGALCAKIFQRALAFGLAAEDDASLIKLARHENKVKQ
jgi:L-threonate 2-dehydrogenase